MSPSSTCPVYDISRTNASVSIVQTIFWYLLLIKFNVCLTWRWSVSSVSYLRTETWVQLGAGGWETY